MAKDVFFFSTFEGLENANVEMRKGKLDERDATLVAKDRSPLSLSRYR